MKQRQIKFRAWNKIVERMDYEPEVGCAGGEDFAINDAFHDEEQIFMQFTGLLDKNGKEIYEGDILRITDRFQDWDDICEVICPISNFACKRIKFDNVKKSPFTPEEQGYQIGKCLMGFRRQEDREIIRNVYENPELI